MGNKDFHHTLESLTDSLRAAKKRCNRCFDRIDKCSDGMESYLDKIKRNMRGIYKSPELRFDATNE